MHVGDGGRYGGRNPRGSIIVKVHGFNENYDKKVEQMRGRFLCVVGNDVFVFSGG